jgi:hypothetical protein
MIAGIVFSFEQRCICDQNPDVMSTLRTGTCWKAILVLYTAKQVCEILEDVCDLSWERGQRVGFKSISTPCSPVKMEYEIHQLG